MFWSDFKDIWNRSFSTFAKFSKKTNISRTRPYQGVRNVNFSENFVNVLNKWPLCVSAHICYLKICFFEKIYLAEILDNMPMF